MTTTKVKEYYEFISDYIQDWTETVIDHVTIQLEVNYKRKTVSIVWREWDRFQFREFNHFNKSKAVMKLMDAALTYWEKLLANYRA